MRSIVQSMSAAIAHRGPDASSVWIDEHAAVALGHCRLSIIELSKAGHQPMTSACGRYTVAFNGEIYNHLLLRREIETQRSVSGLAGLFWRGASDTETLLEAVAIWGIHEALKRFVGMFAFALWDRDERALTLARDRLGEKPLYYAMQGQTVLFGSELKALRAHPEFKREIDRNAVALFLRHGYVPAPYTIYKGVRKLAPGSHVRIPATRPIASLAEAPTFYWSAHEAAEAGAANPFPGSDHDAEQELGRLLEQSTAGQMVADVPLGAFLSGGIDSSTVVALMQRRASGPVKTFTIGFRDKRYDEAEYARAIAKHLGTQHTEFYVSPERAHALIQRLPALFDEPFADASQIPTYLVCELARREVKVSLSGDGGDELFGGYNRYVWSTRIWKQVGGWPRSARAFMAGMISAVPPSLWGTAFRALAPLLPSAWRYADAEDKVQKLAEVLAAHAPEDVYSSLVALWKKPTSLIVGDVESPIVLADQASLPPMPDLAQRMMYLDLISYLPDDLLVKLDRTAMAVSLETRTPMLDHRVVEFALRLPIGMKIREGRGKWLLRRLLDRYVPRALIERPKSGFGVPLDDWLRGPLRGWAESVLDAKRIRDQGFLSSHAVRTAWGQHLSRRRNRGQQLWAILMFQTWLPTA